MDRSDVFISYRRKNLEFAQKLETAFKNEGFEVWIDSEDIAPASPEYMVDIKKGIEGADVVIPIFSPDYFESDICKEELQYAADNHKRIIPIVYKEGFDSSLMPDSVGKVNWVYFCPHLKDENDFDTAFPKLMKGILLNHDYARMHTQYLIRTNEWLEHERNESYLLDGDEISKAETWLATEVKTDPYPYPEQTQYIATSRQVENKRLEKEQALERTAARRQRNFILLFFGGLFIALIWMLNSSVQMSSISQNALQEYIETSLTMGRDYFIDPQMMQAVIDSNGEDSTSFEAHQSDLTALRILYPNIAAYTIDTQGNLLEIGRNPETGEAPPIYIPLDSIDVWDIGITSAEFYHNNDDGRWIVGRADIVDVEGNEVGKLVMEYLDPRAEIENNFLIALGFLLIFTVVSMMIYFILAVWHRIQGWFKKSDAEPDDSSDGSR